MRPLLALGDLMPGFRFTVLRRLGVAKAFQTEADPLRGAIVRPHAGAGGSRTRRHGVRSIAAFRSHGRMP
jgi:hypothetical protein